MLTMRFVWRYFVVVAVAIVITVPCLMFLRMTYKYRGGFHSHKTLHVDTDHLQSTLKTQMDCRFHNCFDVFKCDPQSEGKIKVYIHPDSRFTHSSSSEEIFPEHSYEFESMLQAMRESKFASDTLSESCLFVPSVDLLSEKDLEVDLAALALNSIEGWDNGTNHLLFNVFPTLPLPALAQMHVNTGKAIIAGANFITSNYRQRFDISIPLFNSLTVLDPNKHTINYRQSRPSKLIISQVSVNIDHRKTLKKLEDEDTGVLMMRKCLRKSTNLIYYEQLCMDGLPFKYPALLKDGTFCLIVRGPYFATTLLLDAMMMGCIPVIAMDEYIMPFEDVIDWSRASVRIREFQLSSLVNILDKINENEIQLRRYQAFFLWKKYFSSIDKIVETILQIYNERIFVNQQRPYEEWNGEVGTLEGNSIKPGIPSSIYLPVRPAREHGFTAVILTYNRVEMCMVLMKQLQKVPSLKKIIVVWNNPYTDPDTNKWPDMKKPWKLIKTKTNRLTNRFYPFKEIETEAVMAIDDDILMLTVDEIEFAYQTWKEFPDRLVGFPARIHTNHPKELINGKRLQFKYESEWSNSVSMVLTGAAMYHQIYNHWFTYMLPLETINYIDEKMNCEDIGMNFLISNLTGKAPIKVTPRKRFKCAQCRRNDSLWSESSHFIKRSECLSMFTRQFGAMPLKPVEFRADPVLFQEAIPRDMMAYPDVGIV